jgi:hypothetical protein
VSYSLSRTEKDRVRLHAVGKIPLTKRATWQWSLSDEVWVALEQLPIADAVHQDVHYLESGRERVEVAFESESGGARFGLRALAVFSDSVDELVAFFGELATRASLKKMR